MSLNAIMSIEGSLLPPKGVSLARKRYQKGSLFERNNNWIGRWREDEIVDGALRRVYRNVILGSKSEFPTKRLAQRELDARLSKINRPDYRATPNVTLEAFYSTWKQHVLPQLKGSTQLTLKTHFKVRLLPILGNVLLKDFCAPLLQTCITKWTQERLSRNTVKCTMMTLRSVWRTAKAWGYVAHDPFFGLVYPAPEKVEQRYFTLAELQEIIAGAEEPYKTFYWLAAETGMRSGEIIGLRMQDIDLSENVISIRQSVWRGKCQLPKTKNGVRSFAISTQLAERLKVLCDARANEDQGNCLFQSRRGTPWQYTDLLRSHFKPLLKRLGIADAGFHAFRHGNATLMNKMRVDPHARMARLGHSNFETTLLYTHVTAEDRREQAAVFGKILHPIEPCAVAVTA